MTVPSDRRPVRKSFIYGGVAATAAVALLLAYTLGAFEKRGDIRAEDVCSNVPDRQKATGIFNSVLPVASAYHFEETQDTTADWHFNSRCNVNGDDDKILLILSAEMGSARPWREWAANEIPPNSGGDRTYFNAGVKGISNTEVAAIWVPCYASERSSKQPWNMTVFALVHKPLEASDKQARQTLIDLATDFARQAHKDAKCDLPSKLPS
ncbi:hypothetical protein GCM10010372_63320 [Streptomyces tauricus]|uniref:hypothetical protein n=1 Tax=Streptomyces tauricus TaxID=68274 RepID=UPI0016720505|nr:hypothetical protein [Streptomyces tauricus]GHA54638.1 hypothetical protein GCM10010372_63320 [Streptomyces tauricus]